MNILVVDDMEPTADLLQEYLRGRGHQVAGVLSAAAAGRALALMRFDAVVVDELLQDGKGSDLAFLLRASGDLIPIVLLTAVDALACDLLSSQLTPLGAVRLLRKPADPALVLSALEDLAKSQEHA